MPRRARDNGAPIPGGLQDQRYGIEIAHQIHAPYGLSTDTKDQFRDAVRTQILFLDLLLDTGDGHESLLDVFGKQPSSDRLVQPFDCIYPFPAAISAKA
jgi:hypothetical protein